MKYPKPMIQVKNLWKVYRMGDEDVVALRGVSLDVYQGEICCIFGTSGSGKSTLLNQLAGMEKPTFGDVHIRGEDISHMGEEELAVFRQKYVGFIFQSYNLLPSMTAVENAAMPLMFQGVPKREREKEAARMLERVGLEEKIADRFPRQLSGGQRQRVCIAESLMLEPELLIADEPVSALDVTIQAQIIELLIRLQKEMGLAILFISHDMRVVYQLCQRVMVMKDGCIVESGDVDEVYFHPQHPYTKELLEAAGIEDEAEEQRKGD